MELTRMVDATCLELVRASSGGGDALNRFMAALTRHLDARAVVLYVYDEDIDALYPASSHGARDLVERAGVPGARDGRSLEALEVRWVHPTAEASALETTSLWIVPARLGETTLGVLVAAVDSDIGGDADAESLSHGVGRVLLAASSSRSLKQLRSSVERLTFRRSQLEELVVELERREAVIQDTNAALKNTRLSLEQVDLERERIMDSVPSVLFALDGDGKLLYHNRTFKRLFGDESPQGVIDEVLRRAPTGVELGRHGTPVVFELTWTQPRVGDRVIEVSLSSIERSHVIDRQGARALVVLSDRSEQRALVEARAAAKTEGERAEDLSVALQELASTHEELKRTQARLLQSQKLEAIGKLSGGIAHDYNNILCAILGHANFILETMEPDEEARLDVEDIIAASERGASLTRQLLAFSRKQILQPKVVDIRSVVLGMESMLRRLIGADVELASVMPTNECLVLVDPSQLEQVLLNLVVNARGALPRGGQVNIHVCARESAPPSRYGLTADHEGPVVEIRVSDNGTGMSPEVLTRVFEPFFTTKRRPSEGTGLGMATVYGIVEQSRGGIDVHNVEGRGTQVSVYLPMLTASQAKVMPSVQEDEGDRA